MTTTAPEAAIVDALAKYLLAGLQATASLADSAVVTDWPEPTEDLKLSGSRVVVAVIRAGRAEPDRRLGGPNVLRVTPTTAPKGVIRYEYGQIDLPLTVGLWAWSRAMRDDVDEVVFGLMNRPYWETIDPLVDTTSPAAIAAGSAIVTPANMADIWPGTTLLVGGSETVRVASITPTTFTATFASSHAAGATLVEVAGRRRYAEAGLNLRAPLHFNQRARYDFETHQTLDDAEGGRGSQRQEWRSIRNGTGSIRHVREVTAALQTGASVTGVLSTAR